MTVLEAIDSTKIQTTVSKRSDFHVLGAEEPHANRRKEILEKYPQIRELFGNDSRPVPFVILIVASQLFIAYYAKYMSFTVFILTAWIYGGAASHALSLMTHEISHNLVFKDKLHNELFGIFCNLGMGLPSSTTFKKYHLEHHMFQGTYGVDADLPTHFEAWLIGNSTFKKIIFLFFQFATYGARPGIIRPKTMNLMDGLNYVAVLGFDILLVKYVGLAALQYILLSLILGMGFHPCAGHFIAEHYVFDEGVETYSYYGALNYLCWNVGYHNEHHDFPRVPGWRLPQVKAIAPEFYDNLPQHKSWTYVLWRFLSDPSISPYSRAIRSNDSKIKAQ
eukprot:gene6131-8454_t